MTRAERWSLMAALVALAIVSSWTGVFNGFAYDDRFIVLDNVALRDLGNWWRFFGMPYWPEGWGNDGYRPLTILAFSLEWAAGHGRPWIFHAVNIGLYAAVSVAVFYLAETCLPVAAAWVAAALFAVHPVHVEAVANIVGQSELLVALFMLPAVTLYIRRRNANELTIGPMLVIAALYVGAVLSKEHGIILPALLIAAEVIVVADKAPFGARLSTLRRFGLSLALIAVAYVWVHAQFTEAFAGFHSYVPFTVAGFGAAGRAFTMLGLVPEWFRLFLWPVHLSAEYGPPAFPVVPDFQLYQVPGIVALVGTLALGIVTWRKVPAVSFGIWFLIIALLPTSNFLVPSGILLSERTLFMPSVGAMIALAAVVPWLYRHSRTQLLQVAAPLVLAAILALGAWRSTRRTPAWKDNDTLFMASIVDAPYVYRSHYMLGAWRVLQKRRVEGEREYLTAITLYDRDPFVLYALGEDYRLWKLYEPAIAMFRRTLDLDSTMYEARARLALSLAALGRWPEARREALATLHEDTHSAKAMLGIVRLAAVTTGRSATPGGVDSAAAGDRPSSQNDSRKVPSAVQIPVAPAKKATAAKTKPPV